MSKVFFMFRLRIYCLLKFAECTRVKDEVNAKNNLISPSKLFSVEAQVEVLHSKVRF